MTKEISLIDIVMNITSDIMNIQTNEIIEKQDLILIKDIKGNYITLNITTGTDITNTYWKAIDKKDNSNVKLKKILFNNLSC